MAMFRKGAQLGDVDAMYSLAEMLLRSQPGNIHPEGYEWLKKAAASGHDGAMRVVEGYELAIQRQRQQQQYQQQQGQIMMDLFGQILRNVR